AAFGERAVDLIEDLLRLPLDVGRAVGGDLPREIDRVAVDRRAAVERSRLQALDRHARSSLIAVRLRLGERRTAATTFSPPEFAWGVPPPSPMSCRAPPGWCWCMAKPACGWTRSPRG